MRTTFVLLPLAVLVALAGRRLTQGPASNADRAPDAVHAVGPAAPRLRGRAAPAGRDARAEAGVASRAIQDRVRGRLGGPGGRALAAGELRRLLPHPEPEASRGDALEQALSRAEARLAAELARTCGVVLSGLSAGRVGEVSRMAPVDRDTGTFEAPVSVRPPHNVEALYLRGSRILARGPVRDGACTLLVDPEAVLAGTGDLELGFVLQESGDAVADVAVDVVATDRDVHARASIGNEARGRTGVRLLRVRDVPAGTYHVRATRVDAVRSVATATVDVVAGGTTRRVLSLAPGTTIAMRCFGPDGSPRVPRRRSVRVGVAGGGLFEVDVRTSREDPDLCLVDGCPPGPCWLVTPDRRAHRVDGAPDAERGARSLQLEATRCLLLRVRVQDPPWLSRMRWARTVWTVRDAQDAVVLRERPSLIGIAPDGGVLLGASLPPGRYRARWVLLPGRAVEWAFEVPPGDRCLEILVDPRDA